MMLSLLTILFVIQGWVDGSIFSGLDSKVWDSQATISWDPKTLPGELPFQDVPFLCEFQNVFVDSTSIFFRPKAEKTALAIIDLFDCCTGVGKGSAVHFKKDCGISSSVHYSLCYCFHLSKYVPAIETSEQMNYLETFKSHKQNPRDQSNVLDESHYLKGVTWLMHHWSFHHHPDHFNMKILEFRGLMANKDNPAVAHIPYYSSLPNRVDRVVSMDYPVRNFTDYEQFIYEITEDSFKGKLEWFALNPFENMVHFFGERTSLLMLQRLYSYCAKISHEDASQSKEQYFVSLASFCKEEYNRTNVLPLPFWYAETAYISPRYKNNVPYPYNITQQSFQKSVRNTLQKKLNITTLNCFKPPGREKEYIVAILHRTEGAGLRKLMNLDEITRLARSILKVSSIQEWYIDASMSAANQALYFHCFDVLISSHSSQLTNLIFSQPGSQVIEIQAEHVEERTFLRLGMQVGVDYFFLNKGHQIHKNNHHENASWSAWDYTVNLDALSTALKQAKANLDANKL